MTTITIRDEFIKLGQAMKLAGCVDSGADAREVISGGEVTVNKETELRRGRKLYAGDRFVFENETYEITSG